MKRLIKISLVFLLILFQSFSLKLQAQNTRRPTLFLKPGNLKHSLQKTNCEFKANLLHSKKPGKNAIQNINNHHREIARLRARGKTQGEIITFLDARRNRNGSGSISGTIYENDGFTPVQNFITVEAFDEYGRFTGSEYPGAWSNGAYIITDLAGGYYFVMISSFDYIDKYYDNVTNWRTAALVLVVDGQETANIDFLAEPIPERQGAITGQVYAAGDGAPVPDCFIAAYDEIYNNISYALTDPLGKYIVGNLATGSYRLLAEYDGVENFVEQWYDNYQDYESATEIVVTEPDTTPNIDFALKQGGAITGQIILPGGATANAFSCMITAYDSARNLREYAPNQENGYFQLDRLRAGIYKLQYEYYGSGNYTDGWYNDAQDFESATPISVTTSDTVQNIIINLLPAGAISGRVTMADGQLLPTNNATVSVFDKNLNYISDRKIDENGFYMIPGLPGGSFKVHCSNFGQTPVRGQEPMQEWYPGVFYVEEAHNVYVIAPNTTENIDFKLRQGGAITGQVFDPVGQPLNYVGTIKTYNLQGKLVAEGDIEAAGNYYLTGLPSGDYQLQLKYNGDEGYFEEWYDGQLSAFTADCVRVTRPDMTAEINFSLESSGVIQGFITSDRGERLSSNENSIRVFVYDEQHGKNIVSSETSFSGGYQCKLLAGNYKLAAVSAYVNWMARHDSFAVSYYESGSSLNDPGTQLISVLPDTNLKLNDLVLRKAKGTISGTVYPPLFTTPMQTGEYIILAYDETGYLAAMSAYSDWYATLTGKYLLCGLRPGNYALLAIGINKQNASMPWSDTMWYDGVHIRMSLENLSPEMHIPAEATQVTVNENEISGIDFRFQNTTGINEPIECAVLSGYRLKNNYPNPFNPSTVITYQTPTTSYVELSIYNLIGQKVVTLVSGLQSAGNHKIEWDAGHFTSGVYFYRLKTETFTRTRKMLLVK